MNFERERNEALRAADEALACLDRAQKYLESAANWGLFDLFGGGLLSTAVKHDKMNEAAKELEAAKEALQRFGRELADVGGQLDLGFNTADFLSFADYFLDGFLADWLVQDRIRTAQEQVSQAVAQVERARAGLLGLHGAEGK